MTSFQQDLAVAAFMPRCKQGRPGLQTVLRHEASGRGIVEGVDDEVAAAEHLGHGALIQPLADRLDLYAGRAEDVAAQHVDLQPATSSRR